jgi:biopolymer transport protein ExbD
MDCFQWAKDNGFQNVSIDTVLKDSDQDALVSKKGTPVTPDNISHLFIEWDAQHKKPIYKAQSAQSTTVDIQSDEQVLKKFLDAENKKNPDTRLLIHVDEVLPNNVIIDCVQWAKNSGFIDISIASISQDADSGNSTKIKASPNILTIEQDAKTGNPAYKLNSRLIGFSDKGLPFIAETGQPLDELLKAEKLKNPILNSALILLQTSPTRRPLMPWFG